MRAFKGFLSKAKDKVKEAVDTVTDEEW